MQADELAELMEAMKSVWDEAAPREVAHGEGAPAPVLALPHASVPLVRRTHAPARILADFRGCDSKLVAVPMYAPTAAAGAPPGPSGTAPLAASVRMLSVASARTLVAS